MQEPCFHNFKAQYYKNSATSSIINSIKANDFMFFLLFLMVLIYGMLLFCLKIYWIINSGKKNPSIRFIIV